MEFLRSIPNSHKLASKVQPNSPITEELESLRQKISNLQRLEHELEQAEQALIDASAREDSGSARTVEQIKTEIQARLGFFPHYMTPALEFPDVLENLWRQSLLSYYDNSLPELFKEKLFVSLARYCRSSYSIITHSCKLWALGLKAGEILSLIEQRLPRTDAELRHLIDSLGVAQHGEKSWPEPESVEEQNLLACCMISFLKPAYSEICKAEIRRFIGPSNFGRLTSFTGFVRSFHTWIEAYPEITHESDQEALENLLPLLREEPRLAEVFRSYREDYGIDRERIETEKALRASEERYRELFENANDFIYTHDLEGNLTSLNKAAERITGFSRTEALRMKFTDFVAPEDLELARRMIDRQISGEVPSNFELEIVAKDGQRVALGINTRLIFHEGKPLAIQGIARDITERKKTEEELQQANQKLEAWVNELEQRTREMTLLNEMGDMLRACLTTDEAYSVIVRVAEQIFPVQVGALYIITPSRNLVEAVAVWGNPALAERVFAPDECWALRRGRIHWVENANAGLICKHMHQLSPEGYLCVPMMAQSEALGVLHLTQPENNRMTEAKQRLAVAMAEHIAMALSNLKLHETLRSQSIRDPLTGLFNRRFMEESLELEVRRAARNQRPLGVIMLDLDHFKHFNDTFGHEAGDTLLRELGTLLQTNIRGEDIACRYGGEEFTLILPEGNLDITQQRADYLREAIKRLDVQHRSQPLGRITISMGVAIFPDHGRTGKALLEAADAALYRSKDAGRDRVTTAK